MVWCCSSCSASLASMILYLRLRLSAIWSGQVHVAHELHRQRRAALDRLAAAEHVLDRRAQDALVVDAAVLVEAAVLDRDRGLLERGGDLIVVDVGPQDVGLDVAERGAVGREHLRRLAGIPRLELVDVGGGLRHADDPADDCQARQGNPADRQDERDHEHTRHGVPTVALSAPLSFASAHTVCRRRGVLSGSGLAAPRVDPGLYPAGVFVPAAHGPSAWAHAPRTGTAEQLCARRAAGPVQDPGTPNPERRLRCSRRARSVPRRPAHGCGPFAHGCHPSVP